MSRAKRPPSGPGRLLEASRFLMRQGDVYDTVRRPAERLDPSVRAAPLARTKA